MELTVTQMVVSLLVVLVGSLVQSMVGFGLAVVAAPVLFMVAPALVPGALICMAMLIALLTTRRYVGHHDFGVMKYAVIGRVPGSLVGAWLLTVASQQHISLLMGVAVLLAVLVSVISIKIRVTPSSMLIAGVLSGITGTTSSIGGPPVAIVLQHEKGEVIRANLSFYFFFSSLISLLFLAAAGLVGWKDIYYALILLPAVFAGSFLGRRLSGVMAEAHIRYALLILCSAAGVASVVTSFW